MRLYITFQTVHNQQGAALVVSLFMLLILTLIGVSGMQGTVLQERMASNTKDRSIAFQAVSTSKSRIPFWYALTISGMA